MKKTKLTAIAIAASLVSAVSCQKESGQTVSLKEISFTAETSPKTVLENSGAVSWKSTDKIGIFAGSAVYEFTTEESGASVTFTGSAPEASSYYAVYPYSPSATISGSGIRTVIPVEQTAVKGGFADNANVTVAYTENSTLAFKNVCGLVTFTITRDDIRKVEFKGGNSEKVAGEVEITVSDTPSATAANGSLTAALVAAGDALAPGEYNLLVLPQAYSGFTLTFTDKDGRTDTVSSTGDFVVERSSGRSLGEVDTDIFKSASTSYCLDLSTVGFDSSFIYDVKDASGNIIAIVCKEYLGTVDNRQAVTVYGTNELKGQRVMDSVNPVCLVARVLKSAAADEYKTYTEVDPAETVHGGYFSFKNGETGYTVKGSRTAIGTVYITLDSETGITTVSDESVEGATAVTATPRTLVLSDRGDTKAYKLVKINRLIWMAENLMTAKFNDETDITKSAKAAELQNATGPEYVAANTSSYAYNGEVVLSEKLGTEDGWGVPSKSDAQTMYGFCGTKSYTMSFTNNNVSGFSNRYKGRVTTKWDNTLDAAFWCSNAKDASDKMQCFVIRADDATNINATTAAQSYKYGFWIRLKHILF